MRRALVYVALVLVLVLAASAAAQEPASMPTWQQCTENPYLTPQYPGWKPDAETELTDDDYENCADDDCYRSLLERAINELIHQRAEIANLKRQLTEIHAQQQADRDAMKGVFRCDKPDCIRLQFADPSTQLPWNLKWGSAVITPLVIHDSENGCVIGKGKP